MKILQINNYNYLKGGSEKVYQVSIELLKSHGHDVLFFSVDDPRNVDLCDGLAVKIASWRESSGIIGKIKGVKNFIYNKTVARELESFIKIYKPDIAHIHIVYGALSNAVIDVLSKNNIPIVQSVHEFRLLCPSYTCLDPKLNICEKCSISTYKLACIKNRCVKSSLLMSCVASVECAIRDRYYSYQKNISAFIMVSKFIRNKHVESFPQIATKCYQVYNSVNTDDYSKFIQAPENKGDYYLYIGRLSYEKGIRTLITAFIKNPTLKLKIAGTGPIDKELKDVVNQSGVTNIEFLGFISGDDLYGTIANAKYTVTPSEWYENNPLSVIESMALGTPIIGSNIGGIPELIKDGCNGFLHEPKNIESLYKTLLKAENLNFSQYKSLCKFSVHIAQEKFDNSVYYNDLIKIYNKIIK